MNSSHYKNVTIAERDLRGLVGIALTIDQLISPVVPVFLATFTLLALYLLLTALTAWDPLYALIYGAMRVLRLGDVRQDHVTGIHA